LDAGISQPAPAHGEGLRIAIDTEHLGPRLTERSSVPTITQRRIDGTPGAESCVEDRLQENGHMIRGGRVGHVRLHGLKHNTPSEGRGDQSRSERG
jgi:hypothetical protein